jgi:ATP-binding cassette subfamily B protein
MTKRGRWSDLRLLERLLREARPYWPHIGGVLVLSLLSAPITLLGPLPLKVVVDNVLDSRPLHPLLAGLLPAGAAARPSAALFLAVGLLLGLTLFGQLRGLGAAVLQTYTGERLVLSFRARLFERVQCLSLTYHDKVGVADSLYRIQYDAPAIQWVAIHGVIPLLTAAASLGGMIYVTARIDPQLAAVALVVSPALFVATRVFRRRIRREWSAMKVSESSSMAAVQEALASLRVVKAFGQERRENERFVRRSERALHGQVRLALMNGGFDGLIGLLLAGGTAAVLYIGVAHVQSGVLTLGDLLLILVYVGQLYGPLQMVHRKVADLQASLASAERAFALLDEPPDVPEWPGARALARASGAVTFHDVCFAYPEGPQVLHQVSFALAPGARVGIAGPTGAGKTTLTSLLMRFYDPTAGRILLDGIDLREYRVADLRSQFSLVLQEPVLFSASVAENIAYARPDARTAEIEAAAKRANAHDFISRLPHGYRTQVGERGMSLSGGERQRIALARAFLKDTPMLILDEPTSAVDVATEAAILDAMEQLMRGRTTFLIAHRSSVLRAADIRLRIDDGRVVAWSAMSTDAAHPGPAEVPESA